MGYQVMGSDINDFALQKAQKNIDWTLAKFNLSTPGTGRVTGHAISPAPAYSTGHLTSPTGSPITRPPSKLFLKDATQLSKKDLPESPTLVVTESYLGPPVSQFPTPENIRKTFINLHQTLFTFFKTIKPLLKPGTPIVISFLAYKRHDRYFFLENLPEEIAKLGFQAQPIIPHDISKKYGLKIYQRLGLIYDRPDQIVCREIWKFINK